MAAENGNGTGDQQAPSGVERSLAQRAADRLRRLLRVENLAADAGERYEASQEKAVASGAPQDAAGLGAATGGTQSAAGLAVESQNLGGNAPGGPALSSDPLPALSIAELKSGSGAPADQALGSNGSADLTNKPLDLNGGPAGVSTAAGAGGAPSTPSPSSEPPALSADGNDQGVVIEDSKLQAMGQLLIHGGIQGRFIPETIPGRYGDLQLQVDGHWVYTVHNAPANDPFSVQHLNNGDSFTEVFYPRLTDATGKQLSVPIHVAVQGTDDAAVISGVRTGAITEDQGPQ
ncbi:MAG: hypothetical protein EBZ76_03275, partial [Synechococcaceae bacterium WB9_2_170]|nr:hypothetical protein [Synechococcaceae bacterium WB9_2_170]